MAGIRLIPDCTVSVGGKKLEGADGAAVTRVLVDLDNDLFGQCEIVFNDPKLALINGKKFQSGTPIKVEIGFAHKQKKVFEGEVVALEPRFVRDLPPALHVICQESLHRLALSQMTRSFNDVDEKEVAQKIATEHGLTADAPAGTKGHLLQSNITDAAFLRRLAQSHGNHLRMEGKKLVVGPPPSGAQVVLGPDSGLQKAKVVIKSNSQVSDVSVHGWDPKAKKEIVGKAKPQGETHEGAKKYGKGTLSVAGHEHAPTDTATAEKMAKGRLRKLAEGFVTLQADVIGNPDLVPGASVELQKMGAQIDGAYRVDKAVHTFSRHGYWIRLRAVRTSKKTSAQKAAEKAQKDAQKQAKEEADEARKKQQTSQKPAGQADTKPKEEPIDLKGVISGPNSPAAPPEEKPSLDHISLEPDHLETPPEPATPSASCELGAAHFETDKALPLPGAIPTLRGIAAYSADHKDSVLLVVGHTDRVGTAAHNMQLSDDRAQSVAAYLRNDASAWMRFYGHPTQSARWGTREDQLMLSALPWAESPYYTDEIDGDAGPKTRAALKAFQRAAGREATGKADDDTRRALIDAYMKAEGTTVSNELRTLACGSRHPVEDVKGASEKNRRVEIYAFDSRDIKPAPENCTNGKHPGCDVLDRWRGAIHVVVDPGNADARENRYRLQLVDVDGAPIANTGCKIQSGDDSRDVTTDGDGILEAKFAHGVAEAKLTVGDHVLELALNQLKPLDDETDYVAAVQGRLSNLGYYTGPIDGSANQDFEDAVRTFRSHNGLPDVATYNEPDFKDALAKAHGN